MPQRSRQQTLFFSAELSARFIFPPFPFALEKKKRGRTLREVRLKGTDVPAEIEGQAIIYGRCSERCYTFLRRPWRLSDKKTWHAGSRIVSADRVATRVSNHRAIFMNEANDEAARPRRESRLQRRSSSPRGGERPSDRRRVLVATSVAKSTHAALKRPTAAIFVALFT